MEPIRKENDMKIKKFKSVGCTFLGKGLVGRPEMGIIVEAKAVVFDETDIFGNWKNVETETVMYRTSNGFVFDDDDLREKRLEVEPYAPNWTSLTEYCLWAQSCSK